MNGTLPLHQNPNGMKPYHWWACSEPERPDDGFACYDERCRACVIKAKVEVATGRGREHGGPMFDPDGVLITERATLADFVKEFDL